MKVLASSKAFNEKYAKHALCIRDVAAGAVTTASVAGTSSAAVGVAATQASMWALGSNLPWVGGFFAGKATAVGIAAGTAALGSAVVLVPALLAGGGVTAYLIYRKSKKKPFQVGTDAEGLARAFASVALLPMLARAVSICKENPANKSAVSEYLIKEMGSWGYSESYARNVFDDALRQSPKELERRYDKAMQSLESGSTDGIGATSCELPHKEVRKFAENFLNGFESGLSA